MDRRRAKCYAKQPPQITHSSVRTQFLVLSPRRIEDADPRRAGCTRRLCDHDREECSPRSDEVEKVIGHVAGSEGRPRCQTMFVLIFFGQISLPEAGLIEPIGGRSRPTGTSRNEAASAASPTLKKSTRGYVNNIILFLLTYLLTL